MGRKYERHKTRYPGVYYIWGTQVGTRKKEKIFYIAYRNREGKLIEEKAGRQYQHDMTAARAATLRGRKIEGEPSRKEQREAARAKAAAEEGRWTFDKLWKKWKESNANKRGLVVDDNRYRIHLKKLFGGKEPKDVSPFEVDKLRVSLLKGKPHAPGRAWDPKAKARRDESEERRKAGAEKAARRRESKPYAVGTVISVLSLLKRIANFGVNKELCEGLRFKVAMPKGARLRTEDMTEEQMARYIRVCREWPDPQEGNFQLLQLYTGMRRGEVRNLKWVDVDLERGFIHIRDPKGGVDQVIPISDAAHDLLSNHPEVEKNPYVFAGDRMSGPRGMRQISEASRKLRDAAGLPADFRPNHGLRHTFASHLASSGEVDLYTLQRLMTHKSPMMTQRYAHLRDETLKRGANVMSRLVAAAEEKVAGKAE